MKFITFVTLILINIFILQHAYALDEDVYSQLLKASYLYNKGDIDESLEIFESLKKEVSDPFIYNTLAEIYFKKAEIKKAEEILLESAKKFNDPETFYKLGIIYGAIYKDIKKAISFYEKAIKVEEKEKYLLGLAKCYEDMNDYANAIVVYDKLIKHSDISEYHYKKGVLYSKLGLFDKSKVSYEKAIAIDKHLRSMLNLAEIYIMEKKYDDAVKLLEDAINEHGEVYVAEERLAELYKKKGELDKSLKSLLTIVDKLQGAPKGVILKQIGLLYIEKRDFKKAKDYFVKASKINTNDSQALYFAGFCYEMDENYDEALKYYKAVLDLRGDFTFAKKRLAVVYINKKLFDKANTILDELNEKDKDVDYYLIKSMIFSKRNDYNTAIEILKEAFNQYPNSLEVMFELASLYEQSKKYKECEEILKKALALEPDNPVFLNFLGYLYADLNMNLKEAYKMIDLALKKDPENPAYMDSMAWVLYRMKKFKKAYEWQKKALKSGQRESEYIEHMNAILKALGIKKSIDEIIKEN